MDNNKALAQLVALIIWTMICIIGVQVLTLLLY